VDLSKYELTTISSGRSLGVRLGGEPTRFVELTDNLNRTLTPKDQQAMGKKLAAVSEEMPRIPALQKSYGTST